MEVEGKRGGEKEVEGEERITGGGKNRWRERREREKLSERDGWKERGGGGKVEGER